LLAVAALLLVAGGASVLLRSGDDGRGSRVADFPTAEPGAAGQVAEGPGFVGSEAPRRQPNVIVLMTDDLGLTGWERGLPRTRELLAGGTELTEAIVSTPLCCPSRATFQSGRYGHNNGILANNPGYPVLRDKQGLLADRLQQEGYRTALVGKFMNGWDRTDAGAAGEPAPGWDEWVEMRRTYGYYDYELDINGELEQYGSGEEDYLTDVLTSRALEVIDEAAQSPRPLFMWMSWWAPHPELSGASEGTCSGSAIPRDGEPGPFAEERLRAIDSVDEADVSDKPAFLRIRRQLRPDDRRGARDSLRCRLNSLAPVDRGVEAIVARLQQLGELDNTVLIFTSDNGFFHLEHRLPNGKALPYEEAIRVPLVIDLPASWGRQLRRNGEQASNIDLAPTILELAGGCRQAGQTSCGELDGLSLLPLLSPGTPEPLRERALLVEAAVGKPCGFAAVRTLDYTYAEYEAVPGDQHCPPGERELYDLSADPNQLDNLLHASTPSPPAGVERQLRRELGRLERCSGANCHR
jgi:arylsulfatase A-like enzyme